MVKIDGISSHLLSGDKFKRERGAIISLDSLYFCSGHTSRSDSSVRKVLASYGFVGGIGPENGYGPVDIERRVELGLL